MYKTYYLNGIWHSYVHHQVNKSTLEQQEAMRITLAWKHTAVHIMKQNLGK